MPKDLADKVLETIKQKNVKVRSRYLVAMEAFGIKSALVFFVVLAGLVVSVMFEIVRRTGNVSYLSFGIPGLLAFLESFPYAWMSIGIVVLILIAHIFRRFDVSYQKPIQLFLTLFLFAIITTSVAAAAVGATNRLAVITENIPLFGHGRGFGRYGIVGIVEATSPEGLKIKTSTGKTVSVLFTETTHFPFGRIFNEGQVVRVVGKYKDNLFIARGIRPFEVGGQGPGQGRGRHRYQ